MIIIIDNYDSFTYNLFQYIGEFEEDIRVFRNDKITADEIMIMNPSKVVISPGPGTPDDAGHCIDIIKKIAGKISILGICLGHQCIGQAFGGKVIHAKSLYHGKSSLITHNKQDVFNGLKNPLKVARYHSLIVEKDSLPSCLDVMATTDDHQIMAMKHAQYDVIGLQFHPESIMTDQGKTLIRNFIEKECSLC